MAEYKLFLIVADHHIFILFLHLIVRLQIVYKEKYLLRPHTIFNYL